MSKPPDKCYLQWWGDGEPDDFGEVSEHDVSWCKDKIYSHDIEYVRADAILELESENARLRAELKEAKKIFTCDETRSIHCSTKEYPVAALIISYQTYGSGDTPGADYMIKCANLDRAIKEGYGDSLLIMLSVIGEQILRAKRNFNAAAPAAGAPSSYRNALKEGNG